MWIMDYEDSSKKPLTPKFILEIQRLFNLSVRFLLEMDCTLHLQCRVCVPVFKEWFP